MHRLASVLAATLLPVTARAAWPEDVSLSSMLEYKGVRVGGIETPTLSADYSQLVRELGAAISAGSVLPPDTLGARGFEVALDGGMVFTSTRRRDGTPTPWQRAHVDEDPGRFYWAPGITIRKGLPFSTEIGFSGRWVGGSRQGVFGGFGRVGLVEGRKPWPDIGLRMGYTGYVGNDELELGVFDLGASLGSRFRLGPEEGLQGASIAPYVDVSLLVISAAPLLSDQDLVDLGATAYGRRSRSEELPPEPAITTARFTAGVELRAGTFLVRLTGGWTLGATAHVNVATGFSF